LELKNHKPHVIHYESADHKKSRKLAIPRIQIFPWLHQNPDIENINGTMKARMFPLFMS